VVNHEYDKLLDIGPCSGVMVAIRDTSVLLNPPLDFSLRACMPDSITVEQSVAVVVHWLERHPQRWHENFTSLAMSALHDAWPWDE
jgi:Rap1a immunity proteins